MASLSPAHDMMEVHFPVNLEEATIMVKKVDYSRSQACLATRDLLRLIFWPSTKEQKMLRQGDVFVRATYRSHRIDFNLRAICSR